MSRDAPRSMPGDTSRTAAADAEGHVEECDDAGRLPSGSDTEPIRERWVTVTQAARRLGISERAIRKKVERGNLEARREADGNRVRLVVRLPAEEHAEGPVEDPLLGVVRDLRGEVQDLRAELVRERNRAEDLRAERDAARIEAAELRGRLVEATRPGPMARLIEALAARLTGRSSDRQ
jgi:excisionase family DNA binding protein